MATPFDYQSSTPEAIAAHLVTLHKQAYYRAVDYYTKKGSAEMVAKLAQANKLSKIIKLQAEYDAEYANV